VDATNGYITGVDVSPFITSVEKKENNNIVSDFRVTNYPNPFNNSTRIAITLPKNTNGILSIYNIQGSLVKEYSIMNTGKNDYEIAWDGLNSDKQEVSSGIYLGILEFDNPNIKNNKIAKIIYLK
jgi:flagellar hook assembly protein FlgD